MRSLSKCMRLYRGRLCIGAAALLFAAGHPSFVLAAEYHVRGPIRAHVSTGVIVTVMTPYTLEYVQADSKGKPFMPTAFSRVDEYHPRPEKGYAICIIRTKSSLPSVLGVAVDAMSSPVFYGAKKGGPVEKISPDYVEFKCEKR